MSAQTFKQRAERAESELKRVEHVIDQAAGGLDRKGRELHDWLAQIMQVLVMTAGNHKTANALLREALEEGVVGLSCNHPPDDGGDECDGEDCLHCHFKNILGRTA